MSKKLITRVQRILGVYHLFMYCEEVSYQEIYNNMRSVADPKTFKRDVKLLKDIGVINVRYSNRRKAYIHVETEWEEPKYPESITKRQNMERIRRLCVLMYEWSCSEEIRDNYSFEPLHYKLYDRLFPNMSPRTRKRDINELIEIGYIALENTEIWDTKFDDLWVDDEPPRGYYFRAPVEAWDLRIFCIGEDE